MMPKKHTLLRNEHRSTPHDPDQYLPRRYSIAFAMALAVPAGRIAKAEVAPALKNERLQFGLEEPEIVTQGWGLTLGLGRRDGRCA
jgi:hypothetical protein